MDWTEKTLTEPIRDREAWERDSAEAVRRYLEGSPMDTVVDDLRIEGSYPDTKLLVVARRLTMFTDPHTWSYDLWGPDFEIIPGARESPDGVGGLISMWVEEDLGTGRLPPKLHFGREATAR